MAITRWEPLQDIVSLREAMDRLFEESFIRPTTRLLGREVAPVMDIYMTDNEVVVKAVLPGVRPEDVDISMSGETLTIRGEYKAEEEVKREDYYLQERRFGSFTRSVTIPMPVLAEKAEAKFEHGILMLNLPKAEEVRPKPIKVKSEKD